jgi:hypothetical protein
MGPREVRRLLKLVANALERATPVILALLEALSRPRSRKPRQ